MLYKRTKIPAVFFPQFSKKKVGALEEAGDVAVGVDIYLACGGFCGEAGHGHDGASFNDDESRAVEQADGGGGDGEAGRAAEFVWIVREGVLGFCDADGEAAGSHCFDFSDGCVGVGGVGDVGGAVDFGGDGFDFFFDGFVEVVEEVEAVRFFAGGDDFVCEVASAFAAFGEDFGEGEVCAFCGTELFECGYFFVGVCGEAVDGDDDRDAELLEVVDVGFEVFHAGFHCVHVWFAAFVLGDAAVVFEGTDGCNKYDCIRGEAGVAAFDVHELFGAEVGAEACFRDDVVGEFEGEPGCPDGVAAVGDVGERSAVDEAGGVFEGLDKVWFEGVFEEGGHCALCLKVTRVKDFSAAGVADDDSAEPGFEVGDVGCKAEDCHDFGGYGDHEVIFAGDAVGRASHADDEVAQRTVVHVEAAFEGDSAGVDVEGVALLDVVVDHGAEEVVGGGDCVDVAGEVEVDVLHGNDLGVAAAGGTALDAEDGAERGFPECDDGLFTDFCHGLAEADGGGGFSFAGGGRVDGGDEDEFSGFVSCDPFFECVGKFCFVLAVGFEFVGADAELCGDCGNLLHVGLLCDFDVREHGLWFHPSVYG